MRPTATRAVAILLGSALLATVAGAQSAPPPGQAPPVPPPGSRIDDATLERLLRLHHAEAERVRLVLLPTSVTDRRGRLVQGLGKSDFRLYEDRVPQEIRYFSTEATEPLSIAFLLDVSGSMRQLGKLRHAKEAIRYFVDQVRPDDRFALICFADEQVTWVTEFTQNRERFLRRLGVQEGYGQTALNDAVAGAPQLVDETAHGRKAIILITDGADNSSQLSLWQAVRLARRVTVPIYSIGFLSVPESSLPRESRKPRIRVLESIAAETGGRLFAVHDPVELKESIATLYQELRSQYVIGYYPKRSDADGRFRRVRLEVDRRKLQVHTRSGYYVSP